MQETIKKKQLWTCPKCQRQFERQGQSHSCKAFPLEQHFEGKSYGKFLYEKLKRAVEKQIGSFKIESLECCIHFVSTSTFVAIRIFKDKINVDFTLNHVMKSGRINKVVEMSAHRYLYYIDIVNEGEIDDELLQWIQQAYNKK